MILSPSKQMNRLQSFDLLKLFTIFLVVYGHCVQHLLSTNPTDEPVYQYIYTFHMPLFMIISGYFSTSSMKLPVVPFLTKKFIQLLLPCISWGILWWIKDPIISIFHHEYHLHLFKLTTIVINNFWFLKSLFFCYFLYYISNIFTGRKRQTLLVTICFISLFITKYNINFMYPCFITGIFIKKYINIEKFNLYSSPKKSITILIVFIFLLLFWDYRYLKYDLSGFYSSLINKNIQMISEYFYILFYRILIGISGGISFILIFNTIFNRPRKNQFYSYCCECGTYTLGIYILQYFLLERFMVKFICLDRYPFILSNYHLPYSFHCTNLSLYSNYKTDKKDTSS